MRETLEKILALLEHKHVVLRELIERQQEFKRFLIKPEWTRFLEVTRPQEELLNRLRQIQSAQDYLMGDLVRHFRLTGKISIKGILPCLEGEWQRALSDAIEKVRVDIVELKQLTRLGQVLQQAQWRFLRETSLQQGANNNFYTPHGYTRNFDENRFVREV